MATAQQFQDAIVQAHEAGDEEGAQALAAAYKQQFGSGVRPQRSLLDALKEGASNVIPHEMQLFGNVLNLPQNVANTTAELIRNPDARARLAQAMRGEVQHARDVAGGYVQQVRDLSPPEAQGSAPRMAVGPAQAAEAGVVAKYGVNPAPARLAAALGGDIGQPNLNAYDTFKQDIAEHPLSTLAAVGSVIPTPESLAIKAPKLGELLAAPGKVLDAGATPAAEAVRQSALAKVLAQRQAATEALNAAELGRAGDVPLRKAMEDSAAAQAAKGIGVSDIPQAQTLVADLKARLKPTGTVVTMPTPEQAKAYQTIIDTLSPANGQKPSLEMVQNMRRRLAEPAYDDPQGFKAISANTRASLVDKLHDVESAYTGGTSEPVRRNYAAMKAAEDQAEELQATRQRLIAQTTELEKLPPMEAARRAKTIVRAMAEKGLITEAEHGEFIELANAATTAKGKAEFRRRVAATGLAVAGAGAVGGHLLHVIP